MLGSSRAPSAAAGGAAASTGPLAVPGVVSSATQKDTQRFNATPVILAALALLYFVWAMLERHEKIETAIEPKNAAFNLRHIGLTLLTVLLGFGLLKVLLAKLAAWHVWGAAALARFVAGAV